MFKMKVFQFLPLLLLHQCSGSPFLYNVASLLSSASGASSASQNSANVADLRNTKEKQISKQEIAPVDDNDNDFSFNEDPETNNGVVPSIIQKKVNKILRKFAYVTMFANSGNNPSTNDEDFDREKHEFDKEFEQDFGSNNNSIFVNNSTNNSSSTPNRDQAVLPNEIILFDEHGRIEQTTKVTRKPINLNGNSKSQRQEDVRNEKIGSFSISPADIGYFFAELLGSLVGLVYGATAQFNRPTVGATTEPA